MLRRYLQQRAAEVTAPRPDEYELVQRATTRRRRGCAAKATTAAAVAVAAAMVATVGLWRPNNPSDDRIRVAAPDTSSGYSLDADPERARDRGGSGLSFGPLPLEPEVVAFPTDLNPHSLWIDGDTAFAVDDEGWLHTSTDLESWDMVPPPPFVELGLPQPGSASGAPTSAEASLTSSTQRGTLVATIHQSRVPSPSTTSSPCTPSAPTATTLVLSRDQGTTWQTHPISSPDPGGTGPSAPPPSIDTHRVVTDGATVLVFTSRVPATSLECLLARKGLLPTDSRPRSIEVTAGVVAWQFDDGRVAQATAAELGLSAAQLSDLAGGRPLATVVRRLGLGGELAPVATPAGVTSVTAGAGVFYMSSSSDGSSTTQASRDGGHSWQDLPFNGLVPASQMAVQQPTAVDDDGQRWRSTDAATTWQPLVAPTGATVFGSATNGTHELVLASARVGLDRTDSLMVVGYRRSTANPSLPWLFTPMGSLVGDDGRVAAVAPWHRGFVLLVDGALRDGVSGARLMILSPHHE